MDHIDKKSARSEYADRVKAFRRKAGVSQENMAKAIDGIHQPYIAGIEAGEINIGIDNQEKIAFYFGVKHYELSNPDFPVPGRKALRENIQEYIKSTNIDAGYLDDEKHHYSAYIDELLQTDFLRKPRTSKEIAAKFHALYEIQITSTRVSDILGKPPRDKLIEVIKPAKGRINKYQLKPGFLS